MRSRWIVFLPAACLAFFSAPAGASDLITLSVEQPSVLLPILAGDFEVIAHSDRECAVLEVDPFLELLDASGAVVAADDDGWHRQGDCLASRLAGVAGDGFSIRVSGCCGRPYGVIRLEWLSGDAPVSAPSTAVSVPETLPEATSTLPAVSTTLEMSEPSVTLSASTVPEPATTVALEVASTTVAVSTLPPTTEPAITPAPTTSEVISWPTTTIPDRPTATDAFPDPVVSTSVPSSTIESTVAPDPVTTEPVKVPPPTTEPDLFDGSHDDVIPEGSTISVAQRRTVVAVSAVFLIAAPRPSSGSNGSSRRRR